MELHYCRCCNSFIIYKKFWLLQEQQQEKATLTTELKAMPEYLEKEMNHKNSQKGKNTEKDLSKVHGDGIAIEIMA